MCVIPMRFRSWIGGVVSTTGKWVEPSCPTMWPLHFRMSPCGMNGKVHSIHSNFSACVWIFYSAFLFGDLLFVIYTCKRMFPIRWLFVQIIISRWTNANFTSGYDSYVIISILGSSRFLCVSLVLGLFEWKDRIHIISVSCRPLWMHSQQTIAGEG